MMSTTEATQVKPDTQEDAKLPQAQSISSGSQGATLTSRGQHPLQTNWKFWYVQRQFPMQPLGDSAKQDGSEGASQ